MKSQSTVNVKSLDFAQLLMVFFDFQSQVLASYRSIKSWFSQCKVSQQSNFSQPVVNDSIDFLLTFYNFFVTKMW